MKQISQIRIDRSLKRVMKIVGFFAVMATAAVFCLAYLREWADSSLKTAEEVRELTGKTVLASVPKFDMDNHHTRNAAIDPTICYYHRPGSREAESYRTIRTTLFHSMKPGQKVVQFSSPEPSDGKSTTIANMAVAIAQSGKSVLVIDCDLRRPTQHYLFGVKQEIGLTDALLNEIEWANAVKPTVIQGLSLMTAGLCPENPAELLSSAVLVEIIKAARESYDIVLLDSPPVLAVSDPSIVAPHADGMVLVVRMEKNRRPTLTRTKETLEAHGVHVFGVVANGFDAEAAAAAGYNYDSYSSYYSEDEKGSSRKPEMAAKV